MLLPLMTLRCFLDRSTDRQNLECPGLRTIAGDGMKVPCQSLLHDQRIFPDRGPRPTDTPLTTCTCLTMLRCVGAAEEGNRPIMQICNGNRFVTPCHQLADL